MRLMSFVKIAMLAGAVALPSVASAKTMKAPPGSCAVDKKHFVAANTVCSFNCNPQTQWCSAAALRERHAHADAALLYGLLHAEVRRLTGFSSR